MTEQPNNAVEIPFGMEVVVTKRKFRLEPDGTRTYLEEPEVSEVPPGAAPTLLSLFMDQARKGH